MSVFRGDREFDHSRAEGTLILLVNLGTPAAPTTAAVRRYLAEFLSDPRVIELPAPLRWLLLHGVILRFRPRRSAAAYAKVWREDGSPLMVYSQRQAQALQQHLEAGGSDVTVRMAMRYGTPNIASVLNEFRGQGLRRLLVVPMYPQYSGATTGSVFDAVATELKRWRRVPELRMVSQYHDHPLYIRALAGSISAHWQSHGQPERLVMSFHGLPERYLFAGDPYYCQCQATARLLAEQLQFPAERLHVTFQSRVGREKWLQPYTDATLLDLGQAKMSHVQVVCPGFSVDCLETLEEISLVAGESYQQAGGDRFSYIPALNDQAAHIDAIAAIVDEHAGSWLRPGDEAAPTYHTREQRSSAARERLVTGS
jgi:protoporphyrin/coproporphyrin ferrochelatase